MTMKIWTWTLGLTGVLASLPVDAMTRQASARHPELCGVEFRNGDYRFPRKGPAPGRVAVERRAVAGGGDSIVMRFDAPADYVDFVARVGGPADRPLRVELIALDADGAVVDADAGPARAGELVTMQVVADAEVIREVRLRFAGAPSAARVEIFELDVGATPPFCPARG